MHHESVCTQLKVTLFVASLRGFRAFDSFDKNRWYLDFDSSCKLETVIKLCSRPLLCSQETNAWWKEPRHRNGIATLTHRLVHNKNFTPERLKLNGYSWKTQSLVVKEFTVQCLAGFNTMRHKLLVVAIYNLQSIRETMTALVRVSACGVGDGLSNMQLETISALLMLHSQLISVFGGTRFLALPSTSHSSFQPDQLRLDSHRVNTSVAWYPASGQKNTYPGTVLLLYTQSSHFSFISPLFC